jgi:rhodanese-related sulfurtransferase
MEYFHNKRRKKMNYKKLFYLLMIVTFVAAFTGCSKDEDPTSPPASVNEAELLVKYLEGNGDFINTAAPALISAEQVRTNQLSGANQFIIDVRSSDHFAAGHIEGAVNVPIADLINYYKTNNLSSYQTVVIACYSGQSAGLPASLLRLLGYNNVFDLKFGMSSWNSECVTNPWPSSVGNARASEFVTTAASKNAAGELPTLTTGKTSAVEILEARVQEVLTAGFGSINVNHTAVFSNLSSYYIVNYWPQNHYDLGHIPGAVQYTPKADLKFDTFLKTLPTDKPIVIYCYTGQTSSFLATYLKVLGYDAKTLAYGTNAMIYDIMVANGLTIWKESECKNYPYVTGS